MAGERSLVAVVEDAADADVVVGLLFERADQLLGRLAAADDDGAPLERPSRVQRRTTAP